MKIKTKKYKKKPFNSCYNCKHFENGKLQITCQLINFKKICTLIFYFMRKFLFQLRNCVIYFPKNFSFALIISRK